MRPESNQHSLFQPPPRSLVIRLVVKQLKCSSKAKGALIRDECTLARVIDRLFQHIEEGRGWGWGGAPFPLSRSAPCPAATRTAALGRCPGVDTGGGGMVWGLGGWVRVTPQTEEDWPERIHWPWPLCLGCHSTCWVIRGEIILLAEQSFISFV